MSSKEKLKFSVTRKDFEISWFSGKGGGGQHRNKHMNCCRLKHKATGIIKTGQAHRDRLSNQRDALRSMADDKFFRAYCEMKLRELERGKTIEEEVEAMMKPEFIEVCIKDENGKWVKEDSITEQQENKEIN